MKTTKAITTLIAVIITAASASAENRLWTDASGKTIEAEQVNLLNSKVWLRLANGSELKVDLDKLSQADREWAMLNQELALDLKVSTKISRSNSSLGGNRRSGRVQVQQETIQVNAEIEKKASVAYEAKLFATLYVIGERELGYELLEKVETTFAYAAKQSQFKFSSKPISIEKRGEVGRGAEYKGYLLVITDSQGKIVAQKSSESKIQQAIPELIASQKGDLFNEEFGQFETYAFMGSKQF